MVSINDNASKQQKQKGTNNSMPRANYLAACMQYTGNNDATIIYYDYRNARTGELLSVVRHYFL